MERPPNETHITTNDARGAESTNVVRWMLAISLFLAIGLLTAIWVAGAFNAPH